MWISGRVRRSKGAAGVPEAAEMVGRAELRGLRMRTAVVWLAEKTYGAGLGNPADVAIAAPSRVTFIVERERPATALRHTDRVEACATKWRR